MMSITRPAEDGAVFYVAPRAPFPTGSTMTVREVHDTLAKRFPGSGLGVTGVWGDAPPEPHSDGTYEIRAFGQAGAEAVRMVIRYCDWRIAREMSWEEWEAAQ